MGFFTLKRLKGFGSGGEGRRHKLRHTVAKARESARSVQFGWSVQYTWERDTQLWHAAVRDLNVRPQSQSFVSDERP